MHRSLKILKLVTRKVKILKLATRKVQYAQKPENIETSDEKGAICTEA